MDVPGVTDIHVTSSIANRTINIHVLHGLNAYFNGGVGV